MFLTTLVRPVPLNLIGNEPMNTYIGNNRIIGDRFIYCLANREKKRAESYAAWVKETIAAGKWELMRKSLQRGQLTGSPRFVDEIEK